MNPGDSIVHPVSGDAFRSLCNHVFWCNDRPLENPDFQHGDVVFCKIDEVWRLFRAVRRTRKRLVVVTGEGDKPVDAALWRRRPPNIAVWFGTNMEVQGRPSARGLPLGLGSCSGPRTLSCEEIREAPSVAGPRERLLFANFSPHSNESVRRSLLEWLRQPGQDWIDLTAHDAAGGKQAYARGLATHHFVLCPPGNGEDTHRFWEALYAGAVPVIRRSAAMSHFHEIPAVVTEDLRLIERGFLAEMAQRCKAGSPSPLLQLDHWRSHFEAARSFAMEQGPVSLAGWAAGWLAEALAVLRR